MRIHDWRDLNAERDHLERQRLRARLTREAGYDPVWGLLKPPAPVVDVVVPPVRVVRSGVSGRRARSRRAVSGGSVGKRAA